MPPDKEIFHRPDLASAMVLRLLNPGVLDEGLRSGLFISGLRRQGKTTFLLNDLIPALEQVGAIVSRAMQGQPLDDKDDDQEEN